MQVDAIAQRAASRARTGLGTRSADGQSSYRRSASTALRPAPPRGRGVDPRMAHPYLVGGGDRRLPRTRRVRTVGSAHELVGRPVRIAPAAASQCRQAHQVPPKCASRRRATPDHGGQAVAMVLPRRSRSWRRLWSRSRPTGLPVVEDRAHPQSQQARGHHGVRPAFPLTDPACRRPRCSTSQIWSARSAPRTVGLTSTNRRLIPLTA